MDFKVTYRKKGRLYTTVRTKMQDKDIYMTVRFDNETGEVAYPVDIIIPAAFGMKFILYSEVESSCIFPPSIPGDAVMDMAGFLEMFHSVIKAARELIRKEQKGWRKDEQHIS